MLNLPEGVPKNNENFADYNFFHLPLVSMTLVVHLELQISPRIFDKKFETTLMAKKLIHEKTWSRKSRGTVTLKNWKLHLLSLHTVAIGAKTQYGGIVICRNQAATETNKKSKTVINLLNYLHLMYIISYSFEFYQKVIPLKNDRKSSVFLLLKHVMNLPFSRPLIFIPIVCNFPCTAVLAALMV